MNLLSTSLCAPIFLWGISVVASDASWTQIDDFESHALGSDVSTANGWQSENATGTLITADPRLASNQVLHRVDAGGASNSSAAIEILDGATGTFFFRISRESADTNEVFGLSDEVNPDLGNDYGVLEANGGAEGADLRFRDGGGYEHTAALIQGSWYNVWMVVNNASDSWRLFVQSDEDPLFSTQTELTSADGVINFRNGTASNALVSFLIKSTSNVNNSIYYDDFFIDASGSNLTLPTVADYAPVAVDDAVEVGVGGMVAFDPSLNDLGSFDAATVTVLSGPSDGTAVFDLGTGKVVYSCTGSSAGADSFTYQITRLATGGTSTGTVHISISDSLRLDNVTANIPVDTPLVSVGELMIVDALPGQTFPGAIAVTSVPGTPEAVLIGSVKGDIWYVPDTTAAVPVSYPVFSIDELSNFTNGRSIFSVVCFPDFATTGNIIVNYQGRRPGQSGSRLPLPGSGETVYDIVPNLDKNGELFEQITTELRISRFTLSPAHLAAAADGLSTAENDAVIATEFPYLNLAAQDYSHILDDAQFGADGYLYVSIGDEGAQDSVFRNSQKITKDQYSSLLRMDLDPNSTNPKPNPHYSIPVGPLNGSNSPNTPFTDPLTQNPNFRVPADNPFVTPAKGGTWDGFFNGVDMSGVFGEVRDEIWAVGLRNPLKFHLDVDDSTGETIAWLGDVGKGSREEFSALKKGENGGWAYYEGDIVTPGVPDDIFDPMPTGTTPHKAPVFAYGHGTGNSATGGIYYRETRLPSLTNRYIGGDFGSGRIWSMSSDGSSVIELTDLRLGGNRIIDFHLDPVTKDIFVLENDTWSGGTEPRLMRITPQGVAQENYPQTLTELGLFADVASLTPNPGVVFYQPNLKFWSDGADKARWFMISNPADTISYSQDGNWSFPEGMVWVKNFAFDLDRSNPGMNLKRLETRVLVRNSAGSYGVAYRWNEAGTEATLVTNAGDDFIINYLDETSTPATLAWHIPSRTECATCHTATAGHALSMNTRQLNLFGTMGGQSDNFLSLLSTGGYLSGFVSDPSTLERYYRPDEVAIDLEERVRSYLAVNCSYCHQPGGGTPISWDGRAHLTLAQTGMLYGVPQSESSPDATDHIVRPGDKPNSAIWNRINARNVVNGTFNGYTQMPPLASNAFDPQGVAIIEEWIDHYANLPPAPASGSIAQAHLSENATVGQSVGLADAVDPDVRNGIADQNQITYEIISGNEGRLFTLDPVTGELSLNGIIDFERQTQHVLLVEISDHFAPNPGVLQKTVVVDLIDENAPDLTADVDGNGIYDNWEASFGLGIATPSADTDHDGESDFFEFLSGGDPLVADRMLGVANQLNAAGDEHHLGWNVRNGFLLGQDYQIQESTTLGGWQILQPADYDIVSITPVAAGVSRLVIKLPATPTRQFLRLYVGP